MITQENIELYKNNIQLKSRLLTEGCNIPPGMEFPFGIQTKKIHLYAHSEFKSDSEIPEDIILGEYPFSVISRVRYNPSSSLKIINKNEKYFVSCDSVGNSTEIAFVNKVLPQEELNEDDKFVESVCSFLGEDLLGVVPSNHCFYYKTTDECKFCEIWQTYKKEVAYEKPLKKIEAIKKSVDLALKKNPQVRNVAITSGNVKSYDFTFDFFCKIGDSIKSNATFSQIDDFLATLMPPDDFDMIRKLRGSGFNKIYFPMEVFEEALFKEVCPGKYKYGYNKMLSALEFGVGVFGEGNVYTNFVYGIQSLNKDLDPASYDPDLENERSLMAAREMIKRRIIPAFTVYHYAGYNKIGKINLSERHTFEFFEKLGHMIFESGLIKDKTSIIFSNSSLSNTIYNDTFLLAKIKKGDVR